MTPTNRYYLAVAYAQQQLDEVYRARDDWRASHGTQRLINARWGLDCFRRWHHARAQERVWFARMMQEQRAGLFTRVLAAE